MGVPTKTTLTKKFESLDKEVKKSFEHFPKLFDEFPPDVSIAYLFSKIEMAQITTIYCGIVKLHKVNSELARKAVENWHMSREGFRKQYETVIGNKLPKRISDRLAHAEDIRDMIVHGRTPKDGAMRQAIFDIFEYSESFAKQVNDDAKFTPFGSIRGFKGRAKALDKAPSRWILKGMGFGM